ncbi:MAG: SDR family oxidoreductase [Rhodospirillales bacterium]|nr:SDR family oxidoreductase [Rhodospirillales bacterium]
MAKFNNKVCIVTGGASGIGAQTAIQFAEAGGKVVIGDINDELGKALAAKIGENAAYLHFDVSDPDACAQAVEFTVSTFGGVDYVLNSAVRMAPGWLKDLPLENWHPMVNVGLTVSFLMTQAAGRWMIDNGRKGSIVNVSSIGGRQPYGMSGAYSTVKAAVIMLAKHFAIEWAEYGIRVNAICPGHIETPLTEYLQDPVIKQGRADVTPLKRVGQPDDIANGVLFLFSDEADYVTASVLDIDGGVSMTVMNHMPGRGWNQSKK